ncbi:hypothetical protein V6N13_129164 [Hibiscus sabdariffa]
MSGNRPSHVKHPSVLQFFPGTLYFVFSPPSQISRNWQGCYEIKRSHIIHDAGIKDLTLQVEGVEQYGCTTENILRVLQGQRICTLFHRDAHLWEPTKEVGACEMAVAARDSLERLQVSNLAKSIRVLANMEDTCKKELVYMFSRFTAMYGVLVKLNMRYYADNFSYVSLYHYLNQLVGFHNASTTQGCLGACRNRFSSPINGPSSPCAVTKYPIWVGCWMVQLKIAPIGAYCNL